MVDNFIILSFPRFAGGKFIGNCLSLSRLCCPQDPVVAKHLLNSPDDYDYRLKAVMSTLPPSRASMIDWISYYEFGDFQLYQESCRLWSNGVKNNPNELVNNLIESKFRLFLNTHGGDEGVRNLLKVWPNSKIIKLINHVNFSEISRSLKSADNKSIEEHAGNYCKKKYNELAGPDWPSWEEFESVGYNIQKLIGYKSVANEILSFYNWTDIDDHTMLFDIDNSIFNRTRFLKSIKNLYDQLGLTDYNPVLIEKFWQAYMSLHVDNVELI